MWVHRKMPQDLAIPLGGWQSGQLLETFGPPSAIYHHPFLPASAAACAQLSPCWLPERSFERGGSSCSSASAHRKSVVNPVIQATVVEMAKNQKMSSKRCLFWIRFSWICSWFRFSFGFGLNPLESDVRRFFFKETVRAENHEAFSHQPAHRDAHAKACQSAFLLAAPNGELLPLGGFRLRSARQPWAQILAGKNDLHPNPSHTRVEHPPATQVGGERTRVTSGRSMETPPP